MSASGSGAAEAPGRGLTLRLYGIHGSAALDLALCHALIGELDAAERWLAAAARRRSQQPTYLPMRALARTVLDCRRVRHADVVRDLDEHWPEYEAVGTGEIIRPLRILRAFAMTAAGRREAGMAHQHLIKPAYPGEFGFLAVEWPQMTAFLAVHELAGSPARSEAIGSPSGSVG